MAGISPMGSGIRCWCATCFLAIKQPAWGQSTMTMAPPPAGLRCKGRAGSSALFCQEEETEGAVPKTNMADIAAPATVSEEEPSDKNNIISPPVQKTVPPPTQKPAGMSRINHGSSARPTTR
ncbi:hypothetical protein DAKH74_036480 [Maudiozyma humilis]|uniref:Uncharacterized protein n=1 Tax=Maudiozyma humilis TaxID=51915 RepID=A0AAV5S0B5_MAUHU|nr:hypothetical protein DAKH74_036480 [Kazachstania humilis]